MHWRRTFLLAGLSVVFSVAAFAQNTPSSLRLTLNDALSSAFEIFQAEQKGTNLSAPELEKKREDALALVAGLFIDAQRKQQTVKLWQTILEKDQMAYALSKDHVDLDQTQYLYLQAKQKAEGACLRLAATLHLPSGVFVVFLDDKDFLKVLRKNSAVNFNNENNSININKLRAAMAQADDVSRAKTQQRLAAQRSLRGALRVQELGSGSVFAVMKAKVALAMAEDQYNEAQAGLVKTYIDLLHAQGRLSNLVK